MLNETASGGRGCTEEVCNRSHANSLTAVSVFDNGYIRIQFNASIALTSWLDVRQATD